MTFPTQARAEIPSVPVVARPALKPCWHSTTGRPTALDSRLPDEGLWREAEELRVGPAAGGAAPLARCGPGEVVRPWLKLPRTLAASGPDCIPVVTEPLERALRTGRLLVPLRGWDGGEGTGCPAEGCPRPSCNPAKVATPTPAKGPPPAGQQETSGKSPREQLAWSASQPRGLAPRQCIHCDPLPAEWREDGAKWTHLAGLPTLRLAIAFCAPELQGVAWVSSCSVWRAVYASLCALGAVPGADSHLPGRSPTRTYATLSGTQYYYIHLTNGGPSRLSRGELRPVTTKLERLTRLEASTAASLVHGTGGPGSGSTRHTHSTIAGFLSLLQTHSTPRVRLKRVQ
jgi:hypothetical protein